MEENWQSRTEQLIGKRGLQKLANAKVMIYGIGGVGSFAAEALARSGIGHIVLVDKDKISISNINRQIHANMKTVGKRKVDSMKDRIRDINPEVQVNVFTGIEIEQGEEMLINNTYDYIIDAVDTVTTKIKLIERANELQVPIISGMSAGNKLDPCKFEVADIYKTSVCPLAKVMRKELKKRNIQKLKVVYSKEEPKKVNATSIGSIAFVPSVVGLIIASEVVKDILEIGE